MPGLWILDVNPIKDTLAGCMRLKWNKEGQQPRGYLNFPHSDGSKYGYETFFEHFEAEERVVKKGVNGNRSYLWQKKNSQVQNHKFDCRVYNMATKDILVHEVCREFKVDPSFENYIKALFGEVL